jgi:uncharacterized protein (DUF4415 family)
MANEKHIKRYSAAELESLRLNQATETDWERLAQKTDDEIAREASGDPDFADQDDDWFLAATLEMPKPKQLISLRLDAEVVDWFKSKGQGYQTRINAALLAYVKRAKRHGGA